MGIYITRLERDHLLHEGIGEERQDYDYRAHCCHPPRDAKEHLYGTQRSTTCSIDYVQVLKATSSVVVEMAPFLLAEAYRYGGEECCPRCGYEDGNDGVNANKEGPFCCEPVLEIGEDGNQANHTAGADAYGKDFHPPR